MILEREILIVVKNYLLYHPVQLCRVVIPVDIILNEIDLLVYFLIPQWLVFLINIIQLHKKVIVLNKINVGIKFFNRFLMKYFQCYCANFFNVITCKCTNSTLRISRKIWIISFKNLCNFQRYMCTVHVQVVNAKKQTNIQMERGTCKYVSCVYSD